MTDFKSAMGFIGLRELGDKDSQVIGRRKRRGKERIGILAVARRLECLQVIT